MKRLSLLKEVQTTWVALSPANTDVREKHAADLQKKWNKFLKTQKEREKERKTGIEGLSRKVRG